MACYIDFSNLSKGIENLEVCDESVEGFEPHRPRKAFEGFLSAEKVPLKEVKATSLLDLREFISTMVPFAMMIILKPLEVNASELKTEWKGTCRMKLTIT
ncbi:unnamed protein product [Heligmosomoides polygyrus]|uniref:40S ribosomal protein S6 n=1 Tax=Heligmosomoides polygyrus TaxID=6339 RepID=A0A183FB69_HELPZ|nr:unnamed protein product [Heligmosomoides polygyrus]